MACFIGIDVGTSATKAVVTDVDGHVIASASSFYPLHSPRPGWTEQDPALWWEATVQAVGQAMASGDLDPSEVRAIGLSGQMHGSVLLDRASIEAGGASDGTIRPAILWNDQRTSAQCRQIEEMAGGRRALVELVGNAALPGFTLPKLLWVREHEPEHFAHIACVMLPKDYVRFRLTGVAGTDVGDAAGTLLLDVDARQWSEKAIAMAGIDPAILPPLYESAAPAGSLSSYAAERLGLAPGITVVAGSGDNMAGAIGAGVVEPGAVLATLGTSGVIYAHAAKPQRDLGDPPGRLHTMCAGDGDASHAGQWCVTGCTLSAAGSLQWARDALFPDVGYDDLLAEAATVEPGCEGLLFLPYLTGERCPYPDPNARGCWIGLSVRHARGHLVRAILEGVGVTMAQIMALLRGAGVPMREVRIGGGGVRSPVWRQILADALASPLRSLETEEGPAHGAALMAGVGDGHWASVPDACAAAIRSAGETEPDPHALERYVALREEHGALYESLRGRFASLAAL